MARVSAASKKTETQAQPAQPATPVVESSPAAPVKEKKARAPKASATTTAPATPAAVTATPAKAPRAKAAKEAPKESSESESATKSAKAPRTKAPAAEKKAKSETDSSSGSQKKPRKAKSESTENGAAVSGESAPKTLKRKRPVSSESAPASTGEESTVSPIFSVLESLEKRARKSVNQDTVKTDVDFLRSQLEKEIDQLKSSDKKNKSVRVLKVVNKSLRYLQYDLNRVLKTKTKTNRAKNTSSGFMKPVRISKEMAEFTNSDPSQLYSRVHITKFLCKYIKDHSLQNPNDRRQIVCDEKLASLLKIDRNNQPALTYPGIQQHIQQHFIAVADSEMNVAAEESAKP